MPMPIEFSVARSNLDKLIQEYSPLGELSNEAQTRFAFIDRFIRECLDWPDSEIAVEVYEDGGRTDYECGKPRTLIVEAKASRDPLRIPPRRSRNRLSLQSLVD